MKRYLTLMCLLAALTANAQKVPVRRMPKTPAIPTPIAIRQLPGVRAAGLHEMALALETSYAQAMISQSPAVPAPVAHANSRPWLVQQQRNFKAWQLKRQRRLRDQKDQQMQQQREALPHLQPEKTFQDTDFTAYIPEIKQSPRPILPFMQQPNMAFRGLALAVDGKDIRNILQNGLRIEDSGEESNTLRMAYASHGGYAALKPLIENPVINITCSPRSALYWGSKRLNADKRLLVVLQLRGEWDGDGLEISTTDIPASQIDIMAVRLNIDGLLTWCQVTLNPDGSFTITPYERVYAP